MLVGDKEPFSVSNQPLRVIETRGEWHGFPLIDFQDGAVTVAVGLAHDRDENLSVGGHDHRFRICQGGDHDRWRILSNRID